MAVESGAEPEQAAGRLAERVEAASMVADPGSQAMLVGAAQRF